MLIKVEINLFLQHRKHKGYHKITQRNKNYKLIPFFIKFIVNNLVNIHYLILQIKSIIFVYLHQIKEEE